MKMLTKLENNIPKKIYMENYFRNQMEVVVHLLQNGSHIHGYFLLRISSDGMSRFNDVGDGARHSNEFIEPIETGHEGRLVVIGIDVI